MALDAAIRTLLGHVQHMADWIAKRNEGYSFESLGEDLPDVTAELSRIPPDFEWIDRDCVVRGEDFTYRARCLCSFPKTNGKVRYIVEDNGRIFVQRGSQVSFLSESS